MDVHTYRSQDGAHAAAARPSVPLRADPGKGNILACLVKSDAACGMRERARHGNDSIGPVPASNKSGADGSRGAVSPT